MSGEFTARSFYRLLAEGTLAGSRCKACQTIYLPPRSICGNCHVADMEWQEFPGRGRLGAFTVISVPPSTMAREGFDRSNPYCSGVVELEGGVRISARILGVDATRPATVAIGMPLVLEAVRDGDGKPRPVLAFRAAA